MKRLMKRLLEAQLFASPDTCSFKEQVIDTSVGAMTTPPHEDKECLSVCGGNIDH